MAALKFDTSETRARNVEHKKKLRKKQQRCVCPILSTLSLSWCNEETDQNLLSPIPYTGTVVYIHTDICDETVPKRNENMHVNLSPPPLHLANFINIYNIENDESSERVFCF